MDSRSAEYRLTPKARDDLESIWRYSLKQWGIEQTKIYINGLTTAFSFIAKNPASGFTCNDIRTGYRKYTVVRHIIYYKQTTYGIEVVRVLHERMSATRHL